jgi:hypothetical protein
MARRLRYPGLVGTIAAGNLTNSATTHTFTAPLTYDNGTTVPTLAGSDYFLLSILKTDGTISEVVKVTAYNSSTGAATLVRGYEGTPGTAANSGQKVRQGVYISDLPVWLDAGESVPAQTTEGPLVYRRGGWISTPLAGSPVALITLDETSGNFLDQSGNSRDMTPGTGVTRNKTALIGDGGKAAAGDGSHDIASFASAGGIGATGTICAFVRIPAGSVQGTIASVGTSTTGWGLGIGNAAGGAGRIIYGLAPNVNYLSSGYTVPTPVNSRDTYLALALTLSAHVWTWFINGLPVGSNSLSEISPGAGLHIGGIGGGSENLSATVDVDHVSFYSTVLTDAQIKANAFQQPYAPLGWWDGSKLQPLGLT